jgi:adenylate cyclase
VPEIERKFRVAQVPPGLGDGARLRQAYVALDGGVEVRVRSDGTRHLLTVKAGRGLERTEVEVPVGADDFAELWGVAGDRRLEKTRHELDLGGRTAELDFYSGTLAGLAVVEVEFPSRDEAEAFAPPAWFGAEVTGAPGWSNAELACDGAPPDAGPVP